MPYFNPPRQQPSPLNCAVLLGETIREQCGVRGVEEYVQSLSKLLPKDWVGQLAYRLNVPCPPSEPPPPPPPPPPPKSQPPDMERLMQMLRMMERMKSVGK